MILGALVEDKNNNNNNNRRHTIRKKCRFLIELYMVGAIGINYYNSTEFITYELFNIVSV